MHCLIHQLLHMLALILVNAQGTELDSRHQIYLITNDPVFHLSLVTTQKNTCIIYKEIDDFAIRKTSIFRHQMDWEVIMAHRYDRLHAIFYNFINQLIVKLQSLFIWLLLITVRKDAAPGNTCPKRL